MIAPYYHNLCSVITSFFTRSFPLLATVCLILVSPISLFGMLGNEKRNTDTRTGLEGGLEQRQRVFSDFGPDSSSPSQGRMSLQLVTPFSKPDERSNNSLTSSYRSVLIATNPETSEMQDPDSSSIDSTEDVPMEPNDETAIAAAIKSANKISAMEAAAQSVVREPSPQGNKSPDKVITSSASPGKIPQQVLEKQNAFEQNPREPRAQGAVATPQSMFASAFLRVTSAASLVAVIVAIAYEIYLHSLQTKSTF